MRERLAAAAVALGRVSSKTPHPGWDQTASRTTSHPTHGAPRCGRAGSCAPRIVRHCARCAVRVCKLGGPRVTTDEIDRMCMRRLSGGAYPSPLLYRGFPRSCCTSVNEVVCHGIPDDRPLEDGTFLMGRVMLHGWVPWRCLKDVSCRRC